MPENTEENNTEETTVYYEGIPFSDEVKHEASRRYIEVWTQAMDPFQKDPYEVWDPNTSFRQGATAETLESVVQEAIAASDRIWGKL